MREGTLGAEMSGGTPSFSFELFPPKTPESEAMNGTLQISAS